MKLIKNSYLFFIFFILLLSKNFLISLFIPNKQINIDSYTKSLENNIKEINNNLIIKQNYYLGKILYQNPYKFNEEIIIAINTNNLDINNYVISNNYLIGTINKIYQDFIIVKLLTSNNTLLQVKINNCYGLLKYQNNNLIVTNISDYCNINMNMDVYTSNLGYLDDEILIGKVIDIIYDENNITNDYIIMPYANFNYINYVYVIAKE